MGFGQVVVGPPGSGKSTYCCGLQQYCRAISRPVVMINLDPAVESLSYEASVDVRDLIKLKEVMDHNGLGPNGSILFCLEYLEQNLDWLIEQIQEACHQDKGEEGEREGGEIDYIVMDLPGQVELSTDHQSLKNILHRLEKIDWRLGVVHLTDSTHIIDPAKYISIVLLNLKSMLNLGLPQVNVLTKIDLLKDMGDQFHLSYLLPILDRKTTPKMNKLNRVIIEMIEDFNLVGFETLYVEDKASMTKLILAIDRAIGYYQSNSSSFPKPTTEGEEAPSIKLTDLPTESILEIQERWIDYPELYEQHQREMWANEADLVHQQASKQSRIDAIKQYQSQKTNESS